MLAKGISNEKLPEMDRHTSENYVKNKIGMKMFFGEESWENFDGLW